jgi:hypothetical protein
LHRNESVEAIDALRQRDRISLKRNIRSILDVAGAMSQVLARIGSRAWEAMQRLISEMGACASVRKRQRRSRNGLAPCTPVAFLKEHCADI